jgi:hypothetical protein
MQGDRHDVDRPIHTLDRPIQDRPIRVVVFAGGPLLERGVRELVCLLDEHPEIQFLACICQSEGRSLRAVLRDLWRRRRILALPLLLIHMAKNVWRYLGHPRRELAMMRKLHRLSSHLHYVPNIHADEVLEHVRGLRPDLGLIYGSPILKPILFEIPVFGTLGIHHGKLPEYRGKKTTFWAIYSGERTAGVTIQRVNRGLDTGDVVQQGEVLIGHRSPRAVWNDLERLGLDLYVKAILEVRCGAACLRPRAGRNDRLYRDPGPGDILELWRRIFVRTVRDWYRCLTLWTL